MLLEPPPRIAGRGSSAEGALARAGGRNRGREWAVGPVARSKKSYGVSCSIPIAPCSYPPECDVAADRAARRSRGGEMAVLAPPDPADVSLSADGCPPLRRRRKPLRSRTGYSRYSPSRSCEAGPGRGFWCRWAKSTASGVGLRAWVSSSRATGSRSEEHTSELQ